MLYHGVAYYPELWPESEVDSDIAQMKALGINVVRMGEFAWAKIEPEEGKVSLDFFVRVMDKLNAAGIKTVFCTPTATPPIWLTYGHAERSFVDRDGVVMNHGARQHVSYDEPSVRAACLRVVDEVARRIGHHPGLVAWQIDNELRCHVAEDFSAAAIGNWHRWLEERYKTIGRLNDTWGTEIWSEKYQFFAQVPPPLHTPFVHNASLSTAYLTYSREGIANFLDEQCATIRRHSSAPITTNMNEIFAQNFERMMCGLDFAAFDAYPPAKQWQQMVFHCDWFRSAKPGNPFWVMETSVAHNGYLNSYQEIHPPGFLVAEAVSSYGLGADAFCYWLWRQQRTGAELPHSAILSAWGKPGIGYESVMEVENARRQLGAFLQTSRAAVPEVGLTWSDLGRAMLETEHLGANQDYMLDYNSSIREWHGLLLDAGLPRDVRFENAPLDGLKLLFTPDMLCVTDAFRSRVSAWMQQGGIWVCGPLTGSRTAEHTVPTDSALGGLEALAGIETVYSFPVVGANAVGRAWGSVTPLTGWCEAFRIVSPEARASGVIEGDHANGLAFITERNIGRGMLVMLGAQPASEAGRVFLAKLILHYAQLSGVKVRYRASVGTVVCPREMSDGRTAWLAVNMDGAGGTVELPQAAKDALTGKPIPEGTLPLGRYQYRAMIFDK